MKLLFVFGCAFLIAINALAQTSNASNFASFIQAKDLKHHLEVLAHDSLEGRETGKAGQKKAAAFLVDYFKSIGCQMAPGMTSYEQTFKVIETTPGGSLTLSGKSIQYKQDFIYYGCKSKTILTNLPVFTENQLDLVKGQKCYVALSLKGNDIRAQVSALKSRLPKEVVGLVLLAKNYDTLYSYLEHYTTGKHMRLSDQDVSKEFPIFFVRATATTELLSKSMRYLTGKGKAPKKVNNTPVFQLNAVMNEHEQELESTNILAYIPGSDPVLSKEVIVITAHYDHIGVENGVVFNGADDDGTGTASLMSLAKAFMEAYKSGNGPKRSILIMPVSGEEKGLLGSSYYTAHPIIPLNKIVADLNIDMIGRNDIAHDKDTNYVYIIGSNMISNDLHDINEKMNKQYTNITLDYKFNSLNDPNQFYYRSDHYNFAKNGIPVIFYFSGVHEDYHQPTDDVEKIIFSKVERIARLVFYTAWELGTRTKRISLNY
jgi:hypothetical protein